MQDISDSESLRQILSKGASNPKEHQKGVFWWISTNRCELLRGYNTRLPRTKINGKDPERVAERFSMLRNDLYDDFFENFMKKNK